MPANRFNIKGLTKDEVIISREKYGENSLAFKTENGFINAIKQLAKDPMVILLLVAASIYFISGDIANGIFLASAIVLVVVISLYQDSRSHTALEKLKKNSSPRCKVIRDGQVEEIITEDLVIGDSLMVEEGTSISADGIISQSNDFSVNESILTGESFAVFKDHSKEDNFVYKGTTVASGLAIATISAIGNETRFGVYSGHVDPPFRDVDPPRLRGNSCKSLMIDKNTTGY